MLVGLIAAARGAGMLIFGLYGGALADRFDRRRLLIATQAAALVFNVAIGLVMVFGDAEAWTLVLFYVLTFFASALSSIDLPTRQAIVPDIVGRRLTAGGIALNAAGGQIALPVAIMGHGVRHRCVRRRRRLSRRFPAPIWRSSRRSRSCGYGTRPDAPATGLRPGVAWRDVRDGIAYTRGEPVILWVVVLLVAMMGFGFPAVANLGPTWITTVVGVPVRDFGLVAATWGLGALMASMTLARFSRYDRKGLVVAVAALGFGLSFLVFGGGHHVANAVIGNFGLGVSMASAQNRGERR